MIAYLVDIVRGPIKNLASQQLEQLKKYSPTKVPSVSVQQPSSGKTVYFLKNQSPFSKVSTHIYLIAKD